jgi:uncharacterized RDD family membrane protein YckC
MSSNNSEFFVTDDIVASIPQRFLNYIIDAIMQLILMIIVAMISFIISDMMGSKRAFDFFSKLDKNTIGLYTISFSLALLYYNVFEILFARTIGKLITQTIVVDENGEKPHQETILIRSLCRLIPFNPFSVLILGRGWHDSISKTYVVDKRMLDEAKRKFYSLEKATNEE